MRLFHAAAILAVLSSTLTAQSLRAVEVATSPGRLTKVAFAPGVTDQYYITNKQGRIWVVRGGTTLGTPFLDIRSNVNATGEGGLLGLAFDPSFQSNRAFYVTYTTGSQTSGYVVARYTLAGSSPDVADPTSEQILWGPHASAQPRHKAGDIEFAPDGTLMFTIGDGGGTPQFAQTLSSPLGKIHRLDPSLPFPHVPTDNPFVGTPGALESTWAYGLRNPWRFDVDSVTGDVYVGDVGAGSFEEVTRLAWTSPGGNAGWPCQQGPTCSITAPPCNCPNPMFVAPFGVLDHSDGTGICAVIGGVLVRNSTISGLEGQYLYADYCSGRTFRVEDPAGTPNIVEISAEITNGGQPIRTVEIAQSPDGDLYFAEYFSGKIFRIESRPGFENYCSSAPNSTGAVASLTASGSPSISAGNLILDVTSLPTRSFGCFLISRDRDEAPMFGGTAATLCLETPLVLWSALVQNSGGSGSISLQTDLSNLPSAVQLAAGSTWHFQYWTRDADPTSTSATSDAVAVTFEP